MPHSTWYSSKRRSATSSTHGTQHLDLATFPDQLRRLRAVGAINDASDVVAVHLSHHNPIAHLATDWRRGERGSLPDGTTHSHGERHTSASGRPRRIARWSSVEPGPGKSRYAESLFAAAERVTYVATAPPPSGRRRVGGPRRRSPRPATGTLDHRRDTEMWPRVLLSTQTAARWCSSTASPSGSRA